MSWPDRVTVYEVGPRDGLQNIASLVPTEVKVAFVDALAASGLAVVEAAAFVSPKWVPQLGDAAAVMRGIAPAEGVRFPVLVPAVEKPAELTEEPEAVEYEPPPPVYETPAKSEPEPEPAIEEPAPPAEVESIDLASPKPPARRRESPDLEEDQAFEILE